jgi:hypothetical protein
VFGVKKANFGENIFKNQNFAQTFFLLFQENVAQRRRSTITPDQKAVLAESYRMSPFPDKLTRIGLGLKLGMDQRQVQIWFQNERRKGKKSGNWAASLQGWKKYGGGHSLL